MRLTYNATGDVLQIRLRNVAPHHSEEVEPGIKLIYDENGFVMGVEVLDARRQLSAEELSTVTYENVGSGKRASLNLP